MSTQFRLLHNFVRRDDIRFCPKGAVEHVEAKRKQNCDRSIKGRSHRPICGRGVDHAASFKKWRNRRRTLRSLAGLDEHQLRDIGLTRDETGYHALNE
jgi:uncharacterized protein YjiS (DUF1127 family)